MNRDVERKGTTKNLLLAVPPGRNTMYSYHKPHSDSLLKTHYTSKDLKKMKLNEPGRQKLGRYRSAVGRHSIQSYNKKEETSLGILNFCPWYPTGIEDASNNINTACAHAGIFCPLVDDLLCQELTMVEDNPHKTFYCSRSILASIN